MTKTTQLTQAQVKAIKQMFHLELIKPYVACDLGGSLADLVEDALDAALKAIGTKEKA